MRTPFLIAAAVLALCAALPSAESDLDQFMAQVLARRDDNWKKLQQYVLQEDETFQITGPSRAPLYGFRREYQWFPRDGVFIRSPLKADGVTIADADRRKAEEKWVREEQARQERIRKQAATEARHETDDDHQAHADADAPPGLDDLVGPTAEPRFVSSAYFMRFKFDAGSYALAGRERLLGRDVLRIEYYPKHYFSSTADEHGRHQSDEDARIDRKMDKVSLVTLWIEPVEHQILQYEFRNIDFDFLPGRSVARLDQLRASMRMGQPFPGVWLPDTIAMRFGMTLALGTVDATYDVHYRDYKLATVTTKVR